MFGTVILVIFIAIFAAFVVFILYLLQLKPKVPPQLQALADKIGGSFAFKAPANFEGSVTKTPMDATDVVSGQVAGLPFRLFTYGLPGNYKTNTPTFTILEFTLNHQVPHVYLNARADDENVQPLFSRKNLVQLEGVEFSKYFDVYAENNYAQELLQIFEPTVMADFIDDASKVDMEFVNDKLYFYVEHEISQAPELNRIFDSVEALVKDLLPELANVKRTPGLGDSRLAPVAYDSATSSGSPLANLLIRLGALGVALVVVNWAAHFDSGFTDLALRVDVVIIFGMLSALYIYFRTGKA